MFCQIGEIDSRKVARGRQMAVLGLYESAVESVRDIVVCSRDGSLNAWQVDVLSGTRKVIVISKHIQARARRSACFSRLVAYIYESPAIFESPTVSWPRRNPFVPLERMVRQRRSDAA